MTFCAAAAGRQLAMALERIIAMLRDADAEVILMEIPCGGFMTDPYAGLERELARQVRPGVDFRFGHSTVGSVQSLRSARDVD